MEWGVANQNCRGSIDSTVHAQWTAGMFVSVWHTTPQPTCTLHTSVTKPLHSHSHQTSTQLNSGNLQLQCRQTTSFQYSPNLSIYFQGYTFQQIPDKNKIFFKMWQSRIIKKIIEILYFRQIYSVLDYAGCLLFSGLGFAKPNLISCFLSKKTLTTQFHICPLFRFCWQNYTRYFVHVI